MKEIRKLSNEEVASFCGQIAMLLQAGLTPVDCLNVMISDSRSEEGISLLTSIRDTCVSGQPFHKAIENTGAFPNYVVRLLALGEESGTYDECMISLAAYYEKEEDITESIRSAITYPFIMISLMVVVVFVLISRVLPIFRQVFTELGSTPDGVAAALLNAGDRMRNGSVAFLVIIALIFILGLLASRTKKGRRIAISALNHMRTTRPFFDALACERFAGGMALAFGSGLDTYSGLNLVSDMIENNAMKAKIEECRKYLAEGDDFAEAVSKAGIFNNLYSQMLGVGVKTGKVDTVLSKIADNYEHETDKTLKKVISMVEPTLVILLSVIVGMILLSVIMPLMGIMSNIG